jgi:BED zinc finger
MPKGSVYNHFKIIPAGVAGKTKAVAECKYCNNKETENSTRMEFHLAHKCKKVGTDVRETFLSKDQKRNNSHPLKRARVGDDNYSASSSSIASTSGKINTWLTQLNDNEHEAITDEAARMVYGKGRLIILSYILTKTNMILICDIIRTCIEFL